MAEPRVVQPWDPTAERRNRVMGITDGLFAIALTLIVIEIHVPDHREVHSERDLIQAVIDLAPHFLAYGISFLTLTIFWFGQQAQHQMVWEVDRRLATLHLGFLAFVALLPFSTGLLAEYLDYRTAVVIYWLNLLMLGMFLHFSWQYAVRHGLVLDTVTGTTERMVRQRIVKAQVLWAIGAALSLLVPAVGIGFILAAQLAYVINPPIPGLARITG